MVPLSQILSLATDMEERSIDICCVSEIWEKAEDKVHQGQIESLLELNGIKYISNPRRGRRGGGTAIAARCESFSLSKLNVYVPTNVETVWGLAKSKNITGPVSSTIVCSFYSPPDKGKNTALLNHITVTLVSLLAVHKNAGVLICGDRNKMPVTDILSVDPSLQQVVNKPTHGVNILDVIFTNLASFFQEPVILPALTPDNDRSGEPSDHFGVMLAPIDCNTRINKRQRQIKFIRPMPESLLDTFKIKLSAIDFNATFHNLTLNLMVESLENITQKLIEETFPSKKVCIYATDQPWFTEELRTLKRQRLREYEQHGKSLKYSILLETFSMKSKEAVEKYKQKVKDDVTQGNRGSSYPALRKLGARPGEAHKSLFQLPSHAGFTAEQSAECIAAHFAEISKEYTPLTLSSLTPRVRSYIADENSRTVPTFLSISAVKKRIIKAKKPQGIVPGDLPRKVLKHCIEEIAVPAQIIFNRILDSAQYPSKWKIEHQVPIPKIHPPETVNDLRNIAKTSFLSKVFESFVAEWLLEAIKPHLDHNQCGLKGSSINHYLIKLLHFVHSSLDSRKPHSVIATFLDLSKAYNRVDHSLVIEDLYDMKTPAWLLRIIFSYLSNRSMILTFQGAHSSPQQLPAGTPQGAYLGGLIFIIKFNGALLRPAIPRNSLLTHSRSEQVKFIDDGSVAVSIDLQRCLIPDSSCRPLPENFHERTGHILPIENNLMQVYICEAEEYADKNKMVINTVKTDAMIFTNLRAKDFPPELYFKDGTVGF